MTIKPCADTVTRACYTRDRYISVWRPLPTVEYNAGARSFLSLARRLEKILLLIIILYSRVLNIAISHKSQNSQLIVPVIKPGKNISSPD